MLQNIFVVTHKSFNLLVKKENENNNKMKYYQVLNLLCNFTKIIYIELKSFHLPLEVLQRTKQIVQLNNHENI